MHEVLGPPIRKSRLPQITGWKAALSWACIALLIRLLGLRYVKRVDFDGRYYLAYARNIDRGDLFHPSIHWTPYPPVYPFLSDLAGHVLGSLTHGGYAISIACGSGLASIVFLLGERTLSLPSAHLGALLVVFNGHLIRFSDAVLTESLFVFLMTLVLYVTFILVSKLSHETYIRGWMLGALFSLPLLAIILTLTRYIGVMFFLGLLATCLFIFGRSISRLILAALLFALLTSIAAEVIVSSAIEHRLTQIEGHAAPTYATTEIDKALREGELSPSEIRFLRAKTLSENPLRYVRDNLSPILHRVVLVARRDVESGIPQDIRGAGPFGLHDTNPQDLFPFYLSILFGLGVFWAGRQGYRSTVLLLLPILILVAANVIFSDDPRYFIAAAPVYLLFVARAIYGIAASRTGDWQMTVIKVAFLGFIALTYMSDYFYNRPV